MFGSVNNWKEKTSPNRGSDEFEQSMKVEEGEREGGIETVGGGGLLREIVGGRIKIL